MAKELFLIVDINQDFIDAQSEHLLETLIVCNVDKYMWYRELNLVVFILDTIYGYVLGSSTWSE